MKTTTWSSLICSSIFCSMVNLIATPVLAANLIVNGSFENPSVPVGSFINYLGGSTAITGWTVVGVDSAVVSRTFMQSGITFEAQDGNQWIDLAGITANSMTSGVTQNISTTIGQPYDLTFYVGSATDHNLFFPTTVDLSINGSAREHYTNPNAPTNMLNWQSFNVNFTATSSTTNLTFFNGDASNNYNTALDNVSVNAVPGTPGDYNSNGLVDAADYVVWRKNSGTTNVLPNDPIGGTIGTVQYNQWRSHFGQTAGSGGGASVSFAVPEPATLVLLTIVAAGWCVRRGRPA